MFEIEKGPNPSLAAGIPANTIVECYWNILRSYEKEEHPERNPKPPLSLAETEGHTQVQE